MATFFFGGFTASFDGDVVGNHTNDAWVGKINSSNGDIIWANCFGTSDTVEATFGLISSSDGGVVAAGAEGPILNDFTTADAQVIKITADGNEVWTKNFGGGAEDDALGGFENADGSLTLACYTRSTDGDVTNQHGEGDVWIVKLAAAERISSSTETSSFSELKNYPNPFSTSTAISFSLSQSENVSLKIFDVQGRLIRTLTNDVMSADAHELTWDAHDENGNEVNAGIYLLQLQSANESETIRLSVIR